MRALWLRWTWRDLRSRWLQVLATALVLAVGVGAFAGLGGVAEWRKRSADTSLRSTRAGDLRIDLPEGTTTGAGRLRAAAVATGMVAGAEERLIVASQVDASRPGQPLLVPARLIGLTAPSGRIDQLHITRGTGLTPGGRDAVLDQNFVTNHDLPDRGRLKIAGLGSVRYTGTGVSPQYFVVVDESGMSGAESRLAIIYVPLAVARRVAGDAGAVNQLLLRLKPGVDPAAAERTLRQTFARTVPGVSLAVTRGADEPVRRILYRDADNDQKTYTAFAVLLLVGATLASFNLVSRVVESQRREIGIGMALGMPPKVLALRPFALGAQIGLLGAALSVPVGILLSGWIKALFRDFLPLPAYASTFPVALYAVAVPIGAAIPVLAAALPVRRAVNVEPVEAIRTGHRAAGGAGATRLLRRLRVPGGPVGALPLRNLARTPRRTTMTVVGLGAVITSVVAVLSMVDSIDDVADRQRREVLRTSADRLDVTLARPTAEASAEIRRIARTPGVAMAEPGLTVRATLRGPGGGVDVALRSFDAASAIWHPSVTAGRRSGRGVLLAEKAARDLGVRVGDTVVLRHPTMRGTRPGVATSRVRVVGLHADPIRAFAYVDRPTTRALGLGGVATSVTLVPAPRSGADVQRALFGAPGVSSVVRAAAAPESLATAIEAFQSSIRIVASITLILALLVAFTSTSVSVDERRREYATMFAFGLPPRTGLRVATIESVTTGLLGTAVGLGAGLIAATWIVRTLVPDTFPDLGARTVLSGGSIVLTVVVGVLAVVAAPLLTWRRLSTMDIPSTLRVME